jgi:hypothetical protein
MAYGISQRGRTQDFATGFAGGTTAGLGAGVGCGLSADRRLYDTSDAVLSQQLQARCTFPKQCRTIYGYNSPVPERFRWYSWSILATIAGVAAAGWYWARRSAEPQYANYVALAGITSVVITLLANYFSSLRARDETARLAARNHLIRRAITAAIRVALEEPELKALLPSSSGEALSKEWSTFLRDAAGDDNAARPC